MVRKYKYIIGILVIAAVVAGLFFWKTNKKNKIYIGIDGQTITVRGNFPSNPKTPNPEEMLKVGTVIKGENGKDEVVFAVNEDGSYITIPAEDYEQMMHSISNTN